MRFDHQLPAKSFIDLLLTEAPRGLLAGPDSGVPPWRPAVNRTGIWPVLPAAARCPGLRRLRFTWVMAAGTPRAANFEPLTAGCVPVQQAVPPSAGEPGRGTGASTPG